MGGTDSIDDLITERYSVGTPLISAATPVYWAMRRGSSVPFQSVLHGREARTIDHLSDPRYGCHGWHSNLTFLELHDISSKWAVQGAVPSGIPYPNRTW